MRLIPHPPTAPKQNLRASQQRRRADSEKLYAEFKAEWIPPSGLPDDELERGNYESAAFSVWEERRAGRVAAATTPVWVDHLTEWLIGMLDKEPAATWVALPFRLRDNGEVRINFTTRKDDCASGILTYLSARKPFAVACCQPAAPDASGCR